MGVDIYDVRADGEIIQGGAYFRSNWWYWRPVVACMDQLAPDIWERAGEQGMNDGDGLTAEDAHALAAVLTAADAVGDLQRWVDSWEEQRLAVPPIPCELCRGTGIRDDAVGVAHGMPTRAWVDDDGAARVGWCNGCTGLGEREAPGASYPADYDHLIRWRDFLASVTVRFATW